VPSTVRRWLSAAVLAAVAAVLPVAAPAASAGATGVVAGVDYAYQSSARALTVSGWAIDRAHPSASITVNIRVDWSWRETVKTSVYRKKINGQYSASGLHGFITTIPYAGGYRSANWVGLRGPSGSYLTGAYILNLGPRILWEGAKYLGAPYRYGGASPSGFDCSGYTQYVYGRVNAGALVHYTEAQRHEVYPLSASQVRPGDLIFYMSGGSSYHVAIYAGGGTGLYQGWQYAATTPSGGVRSEHIWSQSLQFGSTWHWR
jgi:hypothetical protein